jgi:hypothetical protein
VICKDHVRVLNDIDFFSKLLLSKHKALIGILLIKCVDTQSSRQSGEYGIRLIKSQKQTWIAKIRIKTIQGHCYILKHR